jgi:hypothetical protein
MEEEDILEDLVYRAHFAMAQAEVAEFQATGTLSAQAAQFLLQLPPSTQIQDEKIKACLLINGAYNRALVAVGYALRHAETRQQADAFCGMWDKKNAHAPYNGTIRKFLMSTVWKHLSLGHADLRLQDLTRSLRWLFRQTKIVLSNVEIE